MFNAPGKPDVHTSPGKRRRWRRWILPAVALVLCVWFARFCYLRIARRPTPRPEYWEARLAELDPPPPGAISAQKAFNLLTSRPWENVPAVGNVSTDNLYRILRGPWNETRPEIAAATMVFQTDAFNDARSEMHRVAQAGWRDFVPLAPDALLPSASYLMWTLWLVTHSRWAREHLRDPAAAVDDWLTGLRLSRQLQRQWPAASRRFAYSRGAFIADEMMLAAKEMGKAIDTAALAVEIDRIIGPVRQPAALLEPSRIGLHCFLEQWYVREGGDWIDVSELAAVWGWRLWLPWRPGRKPWRIWNLASPLFYDLATARKLVDDHFAAAAMCSNLVTCAEAEVKEPSSDAQVLSGFVWSETSQTAALLTSYYCMRGKLDAAVAMLAIHEYHRRNGDYPQSLDELMPDLLPRLPIDYADRRPLRYRRTGEGYVLYSIGPDGKDNGGEGDAEWEHRAASNYHNRDIVFSKIRRSGAE